MEEFKYSTIKKRYGTVPRHARYAPEVTSIIFALYRSLSTHSFIFFAGQCLGTVQRGGSGTMA
jgi:hypothetical protein